MKIKNSDREPLIEAFREELLRWNRQINLVSRVETEDRLDGLFQQCLEGGAAVLDFLEFHREGKNAETPLYYFDLGSGGGLPGVIWHLLFGRHQQGVRSWLVEPREKRAWFLNRVSGLSEMPAFGTLCGRWGEVGVLDVVDVGILKKGGPLPVVVISLKALHLDDNEVLSGLAHAFDGLSGRFRVVIARFYPPELENEAKLTERLSIPAPGENLMIDGVQYLAGGLRVEPLGSGHQALASLVLSSYLAHGLG